MRTLQFYSLNNFPTYHTAVLTTVIILCITSLVVNFLTAGSLCLWTTFIHLSVSLLSSLTSFWWLKWKTTIKNVWHLWDICGPFSPLASVKLFWDFHIFLSCLPLYSPLKFTGMVAKLIFMLLQSNAVGEEYGFRNWTRVGVSHLHGVPVSCNEHNNYMRRCWVCP